MSIFNQIINGKGHPKLIWMLFSLKGNTLAKELGKATNYSEALAKKVNHKERKHISIELWLVDERYPKPVSFIADESDMLKLQDEIKDLQFCLVV